jgi:putative ABC transport system permease protein
MLNDLVYRFRALFRRKSVESEMDEELRAHLEHQAEKYVKSGVPIEEAKRRARLDLGGLEQAKEECREARGVRVVEELMRDVRYGLRQLRRNPGFTAVAVMTLALAIGVNTAIFSVLDVVLLRPLPFRNASDLIAVHESIPELGYPKMEFSVPDFEVFQRDQKSFSTLGVFRNEQVDLSGQGEPERVVAARVSASLFPLLGAKPLLGRAFSASEDLPGNDVAILSYGLWQHRYGGNPAIIGQTIEIDRQPYSIIGVMPRDFEFPLRGPEDNGAPAILWVPMGFTPAELRDWGGTYLYSVLGRLRPGVTLGQAHSEADALSRRIIASYPAALATWARRGKLTVSVSPFRDDVVGAVRPLLLVLMGAVGFVLLIACANIATLLVSRAAARQKELAVRAALGATRLRLIRQMLTESLLVALGGGALGLIIAVYARNLILSLVPASITLPHHVPLNGAVLAFVTAASVLAAVLFGLVPAFLASSRPAEGALKAGGHRGTTEGPHHAQGFFVGVECALALILLVCAGLLIRSFGKLLETRPGFRPEHVLTMNVPLPLEEYARAAQVTVFYQQVLDRVSNLPGVESAGLSSDLPLHSTEGISVQVERRDKRVPVVQSWVLGDYFRTMGIPLVDGRWFTPEDRAGAQPVIIVSLSMARKFWPGQSAVGKRIRWGVYAPRDTIVGVVGNVSQGPLSEPLAPHVYRPYLQLSAGFLEEDPFGDCHALNLVVRTHGDPGSLRSAVLAQVHSLDPQLAVANIQTMTRVIRSSLAGPQFNTILLATFAGLALFLASIGVYGVLSYAVARRTHEIGIRVALGAQKCDVLNMIVRQGLTLALIGIAAGIVGALGVTRFLSSLLYGVEPTDPLTFIAVAVILLTVALLASYIPARRAMKVDPMVALRHE